MTLEEIRERKTKLEKDMEKLISDFELGTNVKVINASFQRKRKEIEYLSVKFPIFYYGITVKLEEL